MSTIIEGMLNASGKRFGMVVSRFNELISKKLLEGATDCLVRHHADSRGLTVVRVPGAFEIPMAAKKLVESKKHDAVICLGAIIRGATPHFDYVAAEASKGIAAVGIEAGVPVIYGVLTTDTIEQAVERAGTKMGNTGWNAALSAIEMADLFAKI
ncbi:MAG: 6,7-dimethyl-8-ribityllumazine synthase [Chitinivibrionales bacterium]|nr:6,7-dimethyl-8-ribityllumazine synthase [Chitinivibrionales bacterium]